MCYVSGSLVLSSVWRSTTAIQCCTHVSEYYEDTRRRFVYIFGVQKVSSEVRPVWFVLSGMGTQWPHMGRDLMTLDCFRESIMRSDAVLRPHGIQLYDLLMNPKDDTFSCIVNSIIGVTSIQVRAQVYGPSTNDLVFWVFTKAIYCRYAAAYLLIPV